MTVIPIKFIGCCLLLTLALSLGHREATWDQLKASSQINDMVPYGRSAFTQVRYQYHRKKLLVEDKDLPQSIKATVLGLDGTTIRPIFKLGETTINGNTINVYIETSKPDSVDWIITKINQENPLHRLDKNQNFVLFTANAYPYNTEPGIQHWIMWSNLRLEVADSKAIVNQYTSEQFENITFENTLAKKSVPEIYHVQIFFNRKSSSANKQSSSHHSHLSRHQIHL